jgi:hypothetical protein
MLYRGVNPRFAPCITTACAFCAAKILVIPAALIFLRGGDSSGLFDPRFLERAGRRVVFNGQVMKLLLLLVSPRLIGHLQSEIESGSVIEL